MSEIREQLHDLITLQDDITHMNETCQHTTATFEKVKRERDRLSETIATRFDALAAEVERLRKALKPFADLPCMEGFGDDQNYEEPIQAGDVRRARAALTGKEE